MVGCETTNVDEVVNVVVVAGDWVRKLLGMDCVLTRVGMLDGGRER